MGISYNTSVTRNGLVFYVDAANPKSYPGSGSTWFDLSGYGNHGTFINGFSFSSNSGGSVILNGSNQYINFGNDTSLDMNYEMTILQFIRPDWGTSTWTPFIGKTGSGNNNYRIWVGDDKGFDIQNDPVGSNIKPFYVASSMTTGLWSHCGFTISTGNVGKFYLDGELKKTGTVVLGPTNTENLLVGWDGISAYGSGSISLIQVYNRSLSDHEIKRNFSATKNRHGL